MILLIIFQQKHGKYLSKLASFWKINLFLCANSETFILWFFYFITAGLWSTKKGERWSKNLKFETIMQNSGSVQRFTYQIIAFNEQVKCLQTSEISSEDNNKSLVWLNATKIKSWGLRNPSNNLCKPKVIYHISIMANFLGCHTESGEV